MTGLHKVNAHIRARLSKIMRGLNGHGVFNDMTDDEAEEIILVVDEAFEALQLSIATICGERPECLDC